MFPKKQQRREQGEEHSGLPSGEGPSRLSTPYYHHQHRRDEQRGRPQVEHTGAQKKPKQSEPLSQAGGTEPRQVPQQPAKDPKSRTHSESDRGTDTARASKATTSTALSSAAQENAEKMALQLIPSRANRPQEPKRGKILRVRSNHFAITLNNPNLVAYQYDVAIQPDVPKYLQRSAWNEFAARNFPDRYPSFDGKKIALSAVPLTKEGDTLTDKITVYNPDNGKNKEFTVTIKLATRLDMKNLLSFLEQRNVRAREPTAELMALDIVLRNHAANHMIQAGRSFYTQPTNQVISLGNGLDLWFGFRQSAIAGWKLYLNLDVANRGFPSPVNVIQAIEQVCFNERRKVDRDTHLRDYDIEKLNDHLKNLKVEYKLPNDPRSKRVFRVNAVRGTPAIREEFEMDSTRTNVVEYYATQKNYQIRYKYLPCLWVGSVNNKIYVPMELCSIVPGQTKKMSMNEFQTRVMVRKCAEPPEARRRRINATLAGPTLKNKFTDEFGVSIAGEMEEIEARVLDPPNLSGRSRIINVTRGQWNSTSLHNAMPLERWCVLNLEERCRNIIREFERVIIAKGTEMGMNVSPPLQPIYRCLPTVQEITRAMQALKDNNVNLVFVFVPDRGGVYSDVKKISELRVGVLTQCIRVSTLMKSLGERVNMSTFSNILLKVNAKLNGINHCLHDSSRPLCLTRPVMIVGADVTHPHPGSVDIPSIAAVAASYDPKAFLYNTVRRLQPPKVEIIQDMEEIMKLQLLYFYRQTRYKPERIIIFRDGVSDGQISSVLMQELAAIQRACRGMQPEGSKDEYQPKITFLIVQKRHHTRFFPLGRNEFCDMRNPNVPAGTCVDTKIVNPRDLDFYLVSHNSLLGTARPTKYKLIYDDSDMSESEVETLTYYLCHLLARCTKSISYPAPTYYAHLAAFRARAHIAGEKVSDFRPDSLLVKDCFSSSPMFFI